MLGTVIGTLLPEMHFWDGVVYGTSSELHTGGSCLMHLTCAWCHILLKHWPNDSLFPPIPVMCSIEVPHFLCFLLIQTYSSPWIRHPATGLFFADTHSHFSTYVHPTCSPTHQCPTALIAPKSRFSQGVWFQEGFRHCWTTPGCWALLGKAQHIFCWIQPMSILPHWTTFPHPHPWDWNCLSMLLTAAPSFGSTSPHQCLPATQSTAVQTHTFGVGLKFPRAHSYGL